MVSVYLIHRKRYQDKNKIYSIWGKRAPKNHTNLNIKYRNIKIKQHNNVTYFGVYTW